MNEHLPLCYSDKQLSLSSAVNKRDLDAFRQCLLSGADAEKCNPDTNLSIFEYVCQQPTYHEFIRECISAGCDVNKLNTTYNKRPINFAVESLNYENISALANEPSVNLDAKYEDHTPLNSLAKTITDANFREVFPSIKLLIKRQANPNIANRRELTPILHILRNGNLSDENKALVAQYIIENAVDVDLDTFRKGEARSLLNKNFPHIQLPPVRVDNDRWDFDRLMRALTNEQEADFLHGLNSVYNQDPLAAENVLKADDGDSNLLIAATRAGLVNAAERMLRLNADINRAVQKNMPPVKVACIYGHWRILELFLKSSKLNVHHEEPLLCIVVKKMGETPTNKCDYSKCFNLLLKRKDIDVNESDIYHCTALHYAVRYNDQKAILSLLRQGAYIGAKNQFNRISISDINPKVLEKHLDSCITTNHLRSGDDNFEMIFDFTNLVSPATRNTKSEASHVDSKKQNEAISVSANEMAPIDFMSQSNEYRHLLKHPLIASFLFLKWHRLALIFYVNFILYSIFCGSILTYILLCYREENTSQAVKAILWSLSLVLALCILARELFQLVLSPIVYLKNKENYLEMALVVMVLFILVDPDVSEGKRRTIAAITILLVVGEFFLLTGSLPILSFSTHMVMLKTVSISFFKSLLLYSIILIAFSLCFFTLLSEKPEEKATARSVSQQQESVDEEEADLNKFNNPALAMLKTVVMLTGEFDAASINFNHNTTSYLVFLIFVFLISTVLFNLLNGLAVSDTQAIKSEAELTNFIYRSEMMTRYERIFVGDDRSLCCSYFTRFFVQNRISIFKEFLPLYKVSVLPNTSNQILIHIPHASSDSDSDKLSLIENNTQTLQCTICGNRCAGMEPKIVKYTWQVLEKKIIDGEEEEEKQNLENRIRNIEKSLEIISERLQELLHN